MNRFDHTDLLLTRWALAAVAVVAPLVLVGAPALAWLRGRPLAWSGDTGAGDRALGSLVAATNGAVLTWDGQAKVRLPDAPGGLWIAILVPQVLLATAIVAVALLLRHVVGEIQVGRPFTRSSLLALRATGLVVLGAAVVLPVATGLATSAVMAHAVGDRISLVVSFKLLWLLGGFLVLAVAEAFRAGSRLADDVDGLV